MWVGRPFPRKDAGFVDEPDQAIEQTSFGIVLQGTELEVLQPVEACCEGDALVEERRVPGQLRGQFRWLAAAAGESAKGAEGRGESLPNSVNLIQAEYLGQDSAGTGRSEADRPVRSLRSTSDEAGYLGCRDCLRGDLSRGRHLESPTRAPVELRPPARHTSASRSRTASGLRPAPPPPTPVRWPGESSTFRSRCHRGPHASPRTSFVRTTTDANAAIGRS